MLRDYIYKLKELYRLVTRGYTNYDVYEMHHAHSVRMIKLLTHLRDNNVGYPSELTEKKWNNILNDIIDGFQASIEIGDIEYDIEYYHKNGEWDYTEYNELDKKFKKGMRLFTKHYRNLWD